MKIFSAALNSHDHNTYDGVLHKQMERYTRFKHNIPYHFDAYDIHPVETRQNRNDYTLINKFYEEYFLYQSELLAFTFTTNALSKLKSHNIHQNFINFKPKNIWDYCKIDNQYYIDHHQSHATYAYLSSGYNESDILAIDGNGSNFKCIFIDKFGNITDLSDKLPIGLIWNFISYNCGFGYLNAGKVMGLAAYGQYNNLHNSLFNIMTTNMDNSKKDYIDYLKDENKLDLAFTLQKFTMEQVFKYVLPLKTSDNICIAGGVAYNGYMNEEFTKHYRNVHVPPACGDEGQSLGVYMHADYILNNNIHVPKTYAGQEYKFDEGDPITPREVGQAIADGKIIGWFNGKSESGNRALGNRSILADPRNAHIKDIINETIKEREDFRPFAPAVLEQHYKDYFNTNQPSPYMSRIVPVKSNKIPGVTHIDNTARIQTVNRKQNEKFYDVIHGFYQATGIPMVLNTSFNCKEPIVETPEDAIRTFKRTKLDMVVINGRVLKK
jgi:carbamoyltransferase